MIKIIKILTLVGFIGYCIAGDTTPASNVKDIHTALFNLHIPDVPLLTEQERQERTHFGEYIWDLVQDNSAFMQLISPLLHPTLLPDTIQSKFPDICSQGFAKASMERQKLFLRTLRRHENNTLRLIAKKIRYLYLGSAYSCEKVRQAVDKYTLVRSILPLTETAIVDLPPSRLRHNNKEILHADGIIDYLIIGSGPAGSLIAHELTRCTKGLRIVVVDAGSFIAPGSVITESRSELMESFNQRTTATGGIALRNGWTVGGGSTINLDLAFSPLMSQIQNKMGNWVATGALQQSWFENVASSYHWVTEKLHTRKVETAEINRNNKLLLDATPTAQTYYLNARLPHNNSGEILKISSVEAFLMPALQGGPEYPSHLSLLADVQAEKIIWQTDANGSKKAAGVQFVVQKPLNRTFVVQDHNNLELTPNSTVNIFAKNIIIASGTLGSATLLAKSDLDNDQIGRGIVLHPSIGLIARFDHEIRALDGLSASVFAPAENPVDDYFFEAMSADPGFLALVHPGSAEQIIDTMANFNHCGGFGIMLIDSVSADNCIKYNAETNSVDVHYTLQPQDAVRLRQGLKKAIHMLFEQGACEVMLPTSEPILSDDLEFYPITDKTQIDAAVDRLQFIENQTIISSAHMQGSNKMGNNPQNSVVSPHCKVWDTTTGLEISNLYVCDSSIFPTSVGANPMQSIYTIAKLFVDNELLAGQKRQIPNSSWRILNFWQKIINFVKNS